LAEIFEKPPDVRGRYEPLGKAEVADHDDRSVRLRAGSATVEGDGTRAGSLPIGMSPKGRTLTTALRR
jgi:hypothetical protein